MLKWLERQMPYSVVPADNPVFNYEVRRIWWGESPGRLSIYNGAVFIITQVALWGLWLIFVANLSPPSTTFRVSANLFTMTSRFIEMLILFSIAANIVLDAASLAFSLGAISSEIHSGRWDLIRLTNLNQKEVTKVKCALIEIRAWRVLTMVVSMRVGVVGLLVVTSLFLLPATSYYFYIVPMTLLLSMGYFAIFIVEPLWRMRMFTAVGLAISSRIHNLGAAFLAACAFMIAIWVVQVLVFHLYIWTFAPTWRSPENILLICCGPLIALGVGWAFYVFYAFFRELALQFVNSHAFASD